MVASNDHNFGPSAVTGGAPMTAGQHYWEVEILGTGFAYWETTPEVMFGAVRPSAAAAGCGAVVAPKGDDAFLVDGKDGGLWGQGFAGSAGDARGVFKKGDKIGTVIVAVTEARNSVFQSRGAIKSTTDRVPAPELPEFLPENEVPKSPWTAFPTQCKYRR